MTENEIAKEIVDSAYKVHTTLGPGLLESVYEAALAYELGKRGLHVERQKPLPVVYENVRLEEGFRADLVIVELKSVEEVAPVHKKQLLTYLRLAEKRLGLLINFGGARVKDGITRVVNGLLESARARAAGPQCRARIKMKRIFKAFKQEDAWRSSRLSERQFHAKPLSSPRVLEEIKRQCSLGLYTEKPFAPFAPWREANVAPWHERVSRKSAKHAKKKRILDYLCLSPFSGKTSSAKRNDDPATIFQKTGDSSRNYLLVSC